MGKMGFFGQHFKLSHMIAPLEEEKEEGGTRKNLTNL
jgi:hypothetical protein